MTQRRASQALFIGKVQVGGGVPVVVQSMTNTDTRDVVATVAQICQLEAVGCELVRVAVPDAAAAKALKEIKRESPLPLVADIHFDHRLALAALEAGVDGLRLNPGNLRRRQQVTAVVKAAQERQVPIRIGVNAGSLPPAPGEAVSQSISQRMVAAALDQVHLLEDLGFRQIKISLKAFDVPTTLEAYRTIAPLVPYPLHIGITEAGTVRAGTIRSAVGLGILLAEGIGDTIRVSLTGDPCEEVYVAYEILRALNLRQRGPTLVSCPTCGRMEIDLVPLAEAVERHLTTVSKPIKVAVMGCVVNGPGEAMDADVGIAGGKGRGVLFRQGKVVRTLEEPEFLPALLAEIDSL